MLVSVSDKHRFIMLLIHRLFCVTVFFSSFYNNVIMFAAGEITPMFTWLNFTICMTKDIIILNMLDFIGTSKRTALYYYIIIILPPSRWRQRLNTTLMKFVLGAFWIISRAVCSNDEKCLSSMLQTDNIQWPLLKKIKGSSWTYNARIFNV